MSEAHEPERAERDAEGDVVYSEGPVLDPEIDKGSDAAKRAIRTFLQGLLFDVGVAVVLLLLPLFTDAEGWSDFDWQLVLFSVVKTVVITALSFFLRYFKVVPRTL